MKAFALLVVLAACPKSSDQKKTIETVQGSGDAGRLLPGDASAVSAQLPPAPPLPDVPFGLPPVPAGVLDGVTPETVAMGSALFHDPRLAADGKTTCATCHDPADHFNGVPSRSRKSPDPIGKLMPPQLVNLAWNPTVAQKLPAHVIEALHQDLAASAAKLAGPYQAHIARVGGTPEEAVKKALIGFVMTRYEGDSPWDHEERTAKPADDAGYKLFTGKGHCATCHTPPLYTDLREHDIGFEKPRMTRSLRGAARRHSFFRAESALTMQMVLDFYMAAPTGPTGTTGKSELAHITLTKPEQAQLLDFLAVLSSESSPPTILQPLP